MHRHAKPCAMFGIIVDGVEMEQPHRRAIVEGVESATRS